MRIDAHTENIKKIMKFSQYTTKMMVGLVLWGLIFSTSCSVSDNHASGPNENPNDDTQIEDGGNFNPSEGGDTPSCEEENEDGTCTESTENTDVIVLSTTSIDFGINAMGAIECSEIAIPGGLSFAAELDKTNTNSYAEDTDSDGTTDSTNYQFAFLTGTDSYSTDRTTGTGTLSVCYQRLSKGSHSGQVKLILSGADTTTAGYAYVLKLKGETMEELFNIELPTNYQVVHENANEGVNTDEGEYLITAKGSVNVTELSAIFKDGMNTPVIVNVDGVLYAAYFDESGDFELSGANAIGVPMTPGIYPVEFSLETTKEMVLTEKVYVAVMGKPEVTIEVRDNAGNEINSATTTDASNIIVGVNVSNLLTSGPTSSHTAVVESLLWNGKALTGGNSSVQNEAQGSGMYYDEDKSWCQDAAGSDYTGFDTATTFCVPLATITELLTGDNKIEATVTNELGSVNASFTLILDNTKPVITISSPRENELVSTGITELKISGTVKNYAPLDPSEWGTLDAARESVSGSTSSIHIESDGSGWCVPDATDGSDTSCPMSNVQLWLNTSIYKTPINLYPATSYDDYSAADLNAAVGAPDGDVDGDGQLDYTTGHCYLNTSEEEDIFETDESSTTKVDENGNIVTTTTATDSSGVTTTTVTTTDGATGAITQTSTTSAGVSDTEPTTLVAEYDEDDGYNTTVEKDETTGDVSSVIHDENTDSTTYTTTDAATGTISQYTEQRVCNIPLGTFEVNLTFPSDEHSFPLNLYSNVLEVRATSISDHTSIKVVSFQQGENKLAVYDKSSKDLTVADLGTVNQAGSVDRAPIMLDLSEGVIKDANVILVVQKLLNEQFSFADLAAGGPLPEDENGNIDLDKDFKAEYQRVTGTTYDGNFLELDDEWQKKYIWYNLHASMPQKFLALKRYRQLKALQADTLEELQDLNTAEIMFRDPKDEPNESPNDLDNYNLASDACGHRITTSFMPYNNFYDVYKTIYTEMGSDDAAIKTRIMLEDVWPDEVAKNSDGSVAYDWNDIVQGKWIVESLEFRDQGKIDADICLVPSDAITTGCDEEDFQYYGKEPAFWMHVAGMPLINGGITGIENDPVIPLIWSVGKLRLKLVDVISLSKIPLQDHNELTGEYSNYLNINEEAVIIDKSNISQTWEDNYISIKPFIHCEEFYHNRYDGNTSANLRTPLGCGNFPLNTSEEEGEGTYTAGYPLVLEVNSPAGIVAEELMASGGENMFLLTIVWNEVSSTFREILGCMDTEIVNPMLNPDAFPYPGWVTDGKRFSTSMAISLTDGEFSIGDLEDAVDKLAFFSINLSESDLIIDDDSAYFGIPFNMGVADVQGYGRSSGTAGGGIRSMGFPITPGIVSLKTPGSFTSTSYTQANTTGHLIRSTDDNGLRSLWQNTDHTGITAGVSLNLEELVNALTFLVYQKGPMGLIEDMGVEGLTASDDYTIGVDKVVLGEMGICDNIMNLLKTDLSPGLLFADVESQFMDADGNKVSALHLDINLDKAYPATLALSTLDGTTNTTEVKLGLNNIQIGVKNLYSVSPGVTETPDDTSDDVAYFYYNTDGLENDNGLIPEDQDYSDVIRLRADIVLSLKIVYFPEQQKINIYIEGRDEQNIHLSVLEAGSSYDESVILTSLYDSILYNVFTKLSTPYDGTDADAGASFAVSLNPGSDGRVSLVGLTDLTVDAKMADADNGVCNDENTPYYYADYLAGTIPSSGDPTNTPQKGSVITRSGFSNILKANLKTSLNKLAVPTEIMRLASKNRQISQQKTTAKTISQLSPGISLTTPAPVMPDTGDPCWQYNMPSVSGEEDTSLEASLCDFGIQDVYLQPNIQFDNANGYIHLSTQLWLQVYDWLKEEAQ